MRIYLQSEELIEPQHDSQGHAARESNSRVIMIQWRFAANTRSAECCTESVPSVVAVEGHEKATASVVKQVGCRENSRL